MIKACSVRGRLFVAAFGVYLTTGGGATCISYSSACYAICKGIGLKCRYIQISDWYNHVATAVYVDDGWYSMDTQAYSKSDKSNISNEVKLSNNITASGSNSFGVMMDEYGNEYSISALSNTEYFEYCEYINGYNCHYPLNEAEAVKYRQTGKLPQHVLDDIDFDKATL